MERHYLRATLEFQAVFTAGFLWYATTTHKNWQVDYSWPVFRKKVSGHAFGLDTNHFGTNFIGHPLGGTGYYLSARGNRLSILSSFGFAVAGSGLWELFGEVGEIISTNDSIVTPLAGLAIGEPLTQLGAFFDRSSPSDLHRTLGSVFGPFKSLNDRLDGVHVRRSGRYDALGFPTNEWHRFELGASAALTVQEAGQGHGEAHFPEGRIELSSELARLTGYSSKAKRNEWFSEANLSNLSLELAIGSAGVSDAWFTSRAVLFGHYYRHAVQTERSLEGGGVALGLATGFSYAVHDFSRQEPGPRDRIAGVRPAGLVVASHVATSGIDISSELDAGPDFSGITPLALAGYLSTAEVSALPPVLQLRSYYFGAGYHVTSLLRARRGAVELRGRLRNDQFWGLTGTRGMRSLDSGVPFRDLRSVGDVRFGYYIAPHGAFTLDLQKRLRLGWAGAARAKAAEWSLGLGFQGVL